MSKYSQQEIEETVSKLKKGEVILYPTDTVWGLGCDAKNEVALFNIATLKGLNNTMPFVLLVSSLKMLQYYVPQLPPKAGDLIEFYDRPLTILYEKTANLPDSLKAADGTVAIRLCRDPFCKAFIDAFCGAVVATIAAEEGDNAPKSLKEVSDNIKKRVDYIVQHKQNIVSELLPSTMVRIDENNELVFLRKG